MSEAKRKENAKVYLDWVIQIQLSNNPRLPSLGGGFVLDGELKYSGIRGVRKRGNASAAQITDRYQLGSITKPITGYLIAVLKKQGKLDWSTTLGQIWPDYFTALPAKLAHLAPADRDAWVARYRATTVADLMTHTSGFDYQPTTETNAKLAVASSTVNAQLPAKRRIYTQLALLDRPWQGWTSMKGAPPAKYSGGCIVVAAMAEQVTGRTWEQLLAEQVFGPSGVTQFALANASSKTSVTDLWQHSVNASGTIVAKAIPEETQISYTHGPAGAVSMSIGHWGKWATTLLKTSSDAHMSTAILDEYFGLPDADYNCTRGGWFGADGIYGHDGCNMWNYASMGVDRNKKRAVLSATNIYCDEAPGAVAALRGEMEGVADAWPAMEHLHEALSLNEVSCTANSVWDNTGNSHPTLMADVWFRTRWASGSRTPTVTATLQDAGWLKGLAICQMYGPRIGQFELEIHSGDAGSAPLLLSGAVLNALTVREGLVIKVLFHAPLRTKKVVMRIKSSTAEPTITKLMVLAYNVTRASTFDIASNGRLWVTAAQRRVLTTDDAITDTNIVMTLDTGGAGRAVRKAAGKPWVIGDDGKLWRGEPNGWVAVAGSPVLQRLAVDATNEEVWAIDSLNNVRRCRAGVWRTHPGGGKAKDICAHDGRAWVVGMDDKPWASTTTGWAPMGGNPPTIKRIAVDEGSLTKWLVGTDGRIHSAGVTATSWTEHPGGGRAQDITVHAGLPYVIGLDDGIWKSIGNNGWKRLNVLQPR
jgi:CubicO group peptidase (beta-lactamase class C family)